MARALLPKLILLLLLLVLSAAPAAAKQFNAESFTLANGLQVVVVANHRAPIATQMIFYKVGSADEHPGKTGLAHFLEHLMFKGTKETPPGAFSRIIEQNGGRENAFTTADYTAFYQEVAADRLPLVMKLESERMTGLVLTDAVVLPERQVILEERRTRIDNSPEALLNEQIDADLYLNSPYHHPVIGWESEMRGLTTADALDFYHSWYAPNNAVLVIGGDVTVPEVRALAEKYYGPIAARALPQRLALAEPPKVAATRLVMKSPRVGEASWSRSYLAPSYTAGDTQYAYALQVLAEALGGSATARLYSGLVVDKKLALDAGAFYDPGSRGLAAFGFYATPRKGVAIADLEAGVDALIKAVLKDGLTEQEVDRAKRRMQQEAVFARDSLTGPARIIGAALATGRSLDDVESWPDRIGAVTLDQVNKAARLVIRNDIAVTGVLLPEPTS
ncbi:MAG TPA: pitrilysin family protein [Stellaceae bacterium]|nr:pitrilysin family protein [Stellaceae bacterium]